MKPPKEPPKPAKKSSKLAPIARLFTGPAQWLAIPVVVALALWAVGAVLWRQTREHVLSGPEYRLTSESIALSPAPRWIHTNIADDVLQQMTISGPASLLDDDLAERLAKAFELHPWIAKVNRVEKRYPARVEVSVEYRRPVLMVEVPLAPDEVADPEEANSVPGDARPTRVGGLYPVDAHAVLLPTADFSKVEAANYPRLSDIHTLPLGPVGTPWGDARVSGAAEIAALLFDDWERLRLHRIVPSEQPQAGGSSDDYSYELMSRDGARIKWGQRPSSQLAGEATAREKLDRLRQFLASGNKAGSRPLEIDLRGPQGAATPPRTALNPGN